MPARSWGRLQAEEVLSEVAHHGGGGGDVADPDRPLEVDLTDRVLRGRERQLQQAQDIRAPANVGLRVLAEDVEQVLAPLEELRQADLLLELAQELLLARRTHDVGVLVPVTDVVERVVAAELLIAGR